MINCLPEVKKLLWDLSFHLKYCHEEWREEEPLYQFHGRVHGTVFEDGGFLRLLGLDELLGKWMLEMKTLSTMYPEGDYGNIRCKYGHQVLLMLQIRPHGL